MQYDHSEQEALSPNSSQMEKHKQARRKRETVRNQYNYRI